MPFKLLHEMLLRASGRWTRATKWDVQYARGRWDYLADLDELGHYSILAGYVQALVPGGDLLDVGCGVGLLRQRLHPASFGRYVGIDFSEAVQRARPLADERTDFVVADMHDYAPEQRFRGIVFNETLTYFADPMAGIARYEEFLEPDGVLLVSLFMKPQVEELWARLAARYDTVDQTLVTNAAGSSWLCRAMTVRAA
jgi:2-polyprenyl-3-methyl-5-hydroxy-6-metoxy-1,4-benzoquinol methylase